MPLGIQRLSRGMVASASAPIAASRPLHSAMACTVPRWLWTPRRFLITSSARLGSITVKRGRIEAKYGAFWANANENTRVPSDRDPARLPPEVEDLTHAGILLMGNRSRVASSHADWLLPGPSHDHLVYLDGHSRAAREQPGNLRPATGSSASSRPSSSSSTRFWSIALAQLHRDDREPGPVQRAGHGLELVDDLLDVAPLLDHAQDAGQLSLSTLDPVDDQGPIRRICHR